VRHRHCALSCRRRSRTRPASGRRLPADSPGDLVRGSTGRFAPSARSEACALTRSRRVPTDRRRRPANLPFDRKRALLPRQAELHRMLRTATQRNRTTAAAQARRQVRQSNARRSERAVRRQWRCPNASGDSSGSADQFAVRLRPTPARACTSSSGAVRTGERRRIPNPTCKASRPSLEPLDIPLDSGGYEMAALLPAPKLRPWMGPSHNEALMPRASGWVRPVLWAHDLRGFAGERVRGIGRFVRVATKAASGTLGDCRYVASATMAATGEGWNASMKLRPPTSAAPVWCTTSASSGCRPACETERAR
jgi:hypothetical protein